MSDLAVGLIFFAIVAVCSVPVSIVLICTKHHQRMIQLKRPQAPANDLAALTAEVARLRETCTQYDLSLERSLAEMRQRLERLERRREAYDTTSDQEVAPRVEIGNRSR